MQCQLCRRVICMKCRTLLKLYISFKFGNEMMDVTRCRVCRDSVLVITKSIVIDLYNKLKEGDYSSDSGDDYTSSSSSSGSADSFSKPNDVNDANEDVTEDVTEDDEVSSTSEPEPLTDNSDTNDAGSLSLSD